MPRCAFTRGSGRACSRCRTRRCGRHATSAPPRPCSDSTRLPWRSRSPPRRRRTPAAGATDSAGSKTVTLPNGRTVTLPPGVTPQQLEAVMKRMRSGGQPSVDDRAMLGRIFGRGPRPRGSPNRPTRNNQSYVVFVLRDGKLVVAPIRTGLTDQDYVEVISGLTERDTVLVLPSASLVQSQQQFKQRFQNVTGGGLPGLRQSGGSR